MRTPLVSLVASALLFVPALAAAEPASVMVSSFQARNDDSVVLAGLIEGYVASKLGEYDSIRLVRVEDAPEFEDYSARIYMESCPPGEIVGCTFVVADRAGATWAVTGTVQALAKGSRVDVDIVDVSGSRTAVSFRSELGEGTDEAFAEGVARVLVATMAGEVGREEDIRAGVNDDDDDSPEDEAAMKAELSALSKELGGFSLTLRAGKSTISKPKLTADDIAEREESEGTKPWDRLDMTSAEYLAYKNSKLNLFTWRKRQEGRRFQLLIRGGGGFMNGPVNGEYYGRYAVDAVTLTPVDSYAGQAVGSGTTAAGVLSLGFGVHPLLDISVQGGITGGEFKYYMSTEVVGQVTTSEEPTTTENQSWFAGARATAALMPTSPVRPTFGVGAYVIEGTGIEDHIVPPSSLAVFPAQMVWMAEAFVGGEVRINDNLDFFAQIPISFLVAGKLLQEESVTSVASLEGLRSLDTANAIGVSAIVGLQVRLFGSKPRESSLLDDTDEM